MAKIIYGIQGEGMGHIIRSRAIIDELSRHHEIIIVGSENVCSYFSRYLPQIRNIRIINFKIHYSDNSVSTLGTFAKNIIRIPMQFPSFFKVISLIKKEKPDLIITDFEHITSYSAFLFRIPILSIDNEQVISRSMIAYDRKAWLDYIKSRLTISIMVPRADRYIITSFFFPQIKRDSTFFMPPVLRKSILNLKSRQGNHVLVYQTSSSSRSLIKVLGSIDERFIVYGFKSADKGHALPENIILKDFNESGFFEDLASCKAVIMNGSFTLMTESLFLKKPVFSVPVKKQFEQMLNAGYLQKLGYGYYSKEFSKDSITSFLDNLDFYRKNLKHYSLSSNRKAFRQISFFISCVSKDKK